MQRIAYRETLRQYIHDHLTDLAISLITHLYCTNDLNSVDDNGKSFLHHALEANEENIAKTLLELQKDNPQIIFAEDHIGQTCLLLAAKQGYADIVQIIIDLAKDVKPNTPGYKIWLRPDNNGNTPLHLAVMYWHKEVIKMLLLQLSHEDKKIAKNHINRKNLECNTALHLACFRSTVPIDDELISLLIQNGADLCLTNEKKHTPIHLICERDWDEQNNLLAILLKNGARNIFKQLPGIYKTTF
jgi:ankyrin repeat protein